MTNGMIDIQRPAAGSCRLWAQNCLLLSPCFGFFQTLLLPLANPSDLVGEAFQISSKTKITA